MEYSGKQMGINIPSVTTSVIDRTVVKEVKRSGRTPLIPIFSKFGLEEFKYLSTKTEFEFLYGNINLSRYGIGSIFTKDSFNETTNVLVKRLLPSDATFANALLTYDANNNSDTATFIDRIDATTVTGLKIADRLIEPLETDSQYSMVDTILLSIVAKARGLGYNDIFVTFESDKEYEKADAFNDGEPKYKFNYIKANIYEQATNREGVTNLSTGGEHITFSLMDLDPETGYAIIDQINGDPLFVNDIFDEANSFISLKLNEGDMPGTNTSYLEELRKDSNIDAVLNSHYATQVSNNVLLASDVKRMIVPTTQSNDDTYELTTIREIKNSKSKQISYIYPFVQKISSRTSKISNILKYEDSNGDDQYAELAFDDVVNEFKLTKIADITTGIANYDATKNTVDGKIIPDCTPAGSGFVVDGDTSFKIVKVEEDATEDSGLKLKMNHYSKCMRQDLFNQLLNFNMKLESGSNGVNLIKNEKLVIHADGVEGSESAKDLLVDFYGNSSVLDEFLYPKYDFDYIPDWSEVKEVQEEIIGLANRIGVTMPILSIAPKSSKSLKNEAYVGSDLKYRLNKLHFNSYNSALYTSQVDKIHFDKDLKMKIKLPTSYYALMTHLRIDNNYSITEPVANIVKGNISTQITDLLYEPTSLEIEKLRNEQINAIIVEPDGTYFIDQLTMYKKNSKLSRINIVKVLHRIRKDLPKMMKDLLQLKSNAEVIGTAVGRTYKVLNQWLLTESNQKHGIFESVKVEAVFNERLKKLRLAVTVDPIGTIESIDIPIIVV
jgi:hypothetical protein